MNEILKLRFMLWLAYASLAALVALGVGCAWKGGGWIGVVVYTPVLAAALADAVTPLGLLNFVVLQWFGVRVCKRYMNASSLGYEAITIGDRLGMSSSDGYRGMWRVVEKHDDVHVRLMRYGVLRWIWPLTGWWTDFRYIARRS